jgi:pimeloyl-ACP methyl ester carboxylesterase
MSKQTNFTSEAEMKEANAVNNLLESLRKQSWENTLSEDVFKDIIPETTYINGIAGTIYKNKNKQNGNSVLILTGIFVSRKNFDLFAKRIALQGYMALAIDLPRQGNSKGEWRLGVMSEFITKCVSYLRNVNSRNTVIGNRTKIAVIGHSAGAAASMFAALSYSQSDENDVYSLFERYSLLHEKIVESSDKKQVNLEETDRILKEIYEIYTKIKQVILESLKKQRFAHGEIDAFILLSPPPRFQEVFPSSVLRWLSRRNPKYVKNVIDVCVNTPLAWMNGKSGFNSAFSSLIPMFPPGLAINGSAAAIERPYFFPPSNSDERTIRLYQLKVNNLKRFMEYIVQIKNPVDYMNLLMFFEDKSDFIRHYLNTIVRPVPKLYIYGKWDALLRGFTPKLLLGGMFINKKRQTDIEGVYDLLGNSHKIMLSSTSHFLNEKDYLSVNLNNQMITDHGAVRDILEFLEKNV